MKEKNNKSGLLILILLAVLIITTIILKTDYHKAVTQSFTNDVEFVTIEIIDGDPVNSILNNLVENGLLQKRYLPYAKVYLKLNKLGTTIQAGTYHLPKQLSISELIETLQSGRTEDIWILIPEGLRKDEIADILEKGFSKSDSSTFSKDSFLSLTTNKEYIDTLGLAIEVSDLEGFLFPDRYAFANDSNTEVVMERLVENFNKKVRKEYTYEDIVLASIVEREGYNSTDRSIISGILQKRIQEGWLLQADATLLYPVKDWKHIITVQDKEDDSPYNTYKYLGLPPTPICNPGLEAIEAVWKPTESEYYFYIHDKEKNPHYSSTIEEHNNNVTKYLR